MKLTPKQLSELIQLAVQSRPDDTIGCDGCHELMEEFAQAELDGVEISDSLLVVQAHLAQCRCCRAEYKALIEGLREISH
ncbi:hypothetical protein N9D23_13095 [Rubripirellula sp.]|nr:hypothetical protein [Planctomycetaceae bacterium]MDA9859050.1 hypothetical protein [Rubripirellula sp.]MDF1845082.1 hypothetical protein [Rubripirellula sp.]